MSEDSRNQLPANDLLKNSSLYREFQAEREEILKHKWLESEKAGHDIRRPGEAAKDTDEF